MNDSQNSNEIDKEFSNDISESIKILMVVSNPNIFSDSNNVNANSHSISPQNQTQNTSRSNQKEKIFVEQIIQENNEDDGVDGNPLL